MKILGKLGNEITLLALATENIRRGDYLLISENVMNRRLIVQVYDESYLEALGTAEDMVREEVVHATVQGVERDPIQLGTLTSLVSDMRVLHCKIRGGVEGDIFKSNIAWLPSRVNSEVERIRLSDLMSLTHMKGDRSFQVGESSGGEILSVAIESIDGGLNIVTGRKESGKSHLTKLLVSHLAQFGAYSFVFDLNGEYGGLAWRRNGSASPLCRKMLMLEPGKSLRFTLDYLGRRAVTSLLTHVLDIPGASLREFLRIWDSLIAQSSLTMHSLGDAIGSWRCNEMVRDALFSRYHTMLSSRLFTDHPNEALRIEDVFFRLKEGGLIILILKGVGPLVCRMTVELILSKIIELLEREIIPPCFLFAEEAHLYLKETYWEDIVTRMRHFGIFTTFVTNQPDALQDCIYRQADNIFIFNFTNDADLETISRFSPVDADTVRSIVRFLPQGTCLALGRIVKGMPIVLKVASPDAITLGETKTFFNSNRYLTGRSPHRTNCLSILSDQPSTNA